MLGAWVELSIEAPQEATEAVSNVLMEAGAGGVVIEDSVQSYGLGPDELAPEPSEGVATGRVIVRGYLPRTGGLPAAIESVRLRLACLPEWGFNGSATLRTKELQEQDWANAWKAFYHPIRAGRLIVRPSWEEVSDVPDGHLVMELDPGMAFGTGNHPTTLLCLEALQRWIRKGTTLFDIGTGSGILAIAAGMLGAARVLAVDIDPVASAIASENVHRNRLSSVVETRHGGAPSVGDESADCILANIVADSIIDLAPWVHAHLRRGGVFIASGIIRHRQQDVLAALSANHLAVRELTEKDDWICVVSAHE